MSGFCTNCGQPLDEGSAFCTHCGASTDSNETIGGTPSSAAANNAPSNAAYTSDPTVTTPASEVQPVAAPAPFAGAAPTQVSTAPTAPMMTPPPSQPGVMYTAPNSQPQSAATGNKTWMIVGIAAAAVIIVAAAVIAFTLLGGSKEKLNVSFDTAGGSVVSSSEVTAGTAINEPAAPTRADYKFDGWYLDSTYTSKVTFPYTVKEDTVLHAKWIEDKVTPASTTDNPGGDDGGSGGGTDTGGSSNKNTVTLTVVGTDGSTRTADIHRSGSSERVFPDSNTRRLSQSEINKLSDAEKCIAWNEIIAASNGYSFKNGGLRSYFNGCSWYHANPGASAGGTLSKEASDNVQMLQNSADSWWMHLAAN